MAHYEAMSPKRHYMWANSREILKVDKGKLSGWRNDQRRPKRRTCVQYESADGKKRFHGTSELKKTEFLVVNTPTLFPYIDTI